MDQARFQAGRLSTGYIAEEFPDGFHGLAPTPRQLDLMTAVACAMQRIQSRRNGRTHAALAAAAPRTDWVVAVGHDKRLVRARRGPRTAWRSTCRRGPRAAPGGHRLAARPGRCSAARSTASRSPPRSRRRPRASVIRHRAASAQVLVLTPVSADLHERLPPKKAADTSTPGALADAGPGGLGRRRRPASRSRAGETLCVIEAMKMQNIIRAERDGVVKAVNAKAGDSVGADEVLAEFA